MRTWLATLLPLVLAACAGGLPCQPPSHYAPPAGAPYRAEEVRLQTLAGHTLAGTLTLPEGSVVPLPAVILISGSNAQTRDMLGSTEKPLAFYRPFRQLADTISRRGIAVLRLDDRDTGCSGGSSLKAANTAERADDSRGALAYLRGRPDIDSGRLGLVGISEGATIAVMIAATDHDLRALVSMAGNAGPGWQNWAFQTRYLISLGHEMSRAQKARWRAGEDPEAILRERVAEARAHVASGKASSWWTYFFAFDPLTAARKVKSPALFLHGERDHNIPVGDAEKLARAVRSNGNSDVSVKIFPNHNHLFLPDKDGGFRNYGKLLQHTNQLPDAVLNTIADWLATRLSVSAGRN